MQKLGKNFAITEFSEEGGDYLQCEKNANIEMRASTVTISEHLLFDFVNK